MRIWIILAFALLAGSFPSKAQKLPIKITTDTNQPPKAARTVHLVYDAVQADIYYTEMTIEEARDNSFFVPCAWENGYFGLQQFNGENKRALNFAAWNGSDVDRTEADEPVEVVWSNPSCTIKRLTGPGAGVQCMRQMDWRLGETYRFALQAQVQSNKTAYTAWIIDGSSGKWERLATFRANTRGRWLRGYYSFIEDFRRDFASANQTRRARFRNIWVHQDKGPWARVMEAMFTVSSGRMEAKDAVDAGTQDGAFTLATGGDVKKTAKIGGKIRLIDLPPLRVPEAPDLWFLYEKPAL